MIWLIPKFHLTTRIMDGTNKKSEEIVHISLIFCAFGDFYCDVVKRKQPCLIGVY